jgi:hypothetical protein
MSDFNSVLDDLYSGSARVLVEDVQPQPPKPDNVRFFVTVGVICLVCFCAVFLLMRKPVQNIAPAEEIPETYAAPEINPAIPSKATKKVPEELVFRIQGKIPTSEDDASETKVSADKADALIEKYLHR